MPQAYHPFFVWACILFLLTACEEEFTPPVVANADAIVVEGYIEASEQAVPAYVILTKSFPFFNELTTEDLNNSFVRQANVSVSNGANTVQLTEICLDDIPEELQPQVSAFLGLDADSLGFNLCAYIDINNELVAQEGQSYQLSINTADGQQLSASTTIPYAVPLDSLYFEPPLGEPSDTLAQLFVELPDPIEEVNFYRYFTQIDDGPFDKPFGSVLDDRFFNGQSFHFPLAKAEEAGEDFDQETFGLFKIGTKATIKWMSIDEAHFNFWNTLEFSRANQGPFSSYTRIDHNIEGGIGIWGGIAARYYEKQVEY